MPSKLNRSVSRQKMLTGKMKRAATSLNAAVLLIWLVALNAHGQMNPSSEFLSGKRITFTSAGHPKSKGVEVNFEYPASWGGEEGKRPHVVYQVTSQRGRGLEFCNLVINDLPFPPDFKVTDRDIAEFFDPAGLKDLAPNGARFITGSRTTIDGQPAAMIRFTQAVDRAGLTLKMSWVSFSIYYDKKLLLFGCAVGRGGDTSDQDLDRRFKDYLPLFQLMANSFVIQSKWKRR